MNDLIYLFLLSFLSATLLPGGSELYLIFLSQMAEQPVVTLIIVATLGNTLGGMTNYVLAVIIDSRFLATKEHWFINIIKNNKLLNKSFSRPIKDDYFLKAEHIVLHWGYLALLLSWLPLIGDILCLIAGLYRLQWQKVLFYIFLGKGIRYSILLLVVSSS